MRRVFVICRYLSSAGEAVDGDGGDGVGDVAGDAQLPHVRPRRLPSPREGERTRSLRSVSPLFPMTPISSPALEQFSHNGLWVIFAQAQFLGRVPFPVVLNSKR